MATIMKSLNTNSNSGGSFFGEGFNHFAELIEELEEYHGKCIEQLQEFMIDPLQSFLNTCGPQLKEQSRKLEQTNLKYTSALQRLSQTPQSSSRFSVVEDELNEARSEYQTTTIDFVTKLNDINFYQKHELLETCTSFVYSQHVYHHQAFVHLRDSLPGFVSQLSQIKQEKEKYITSLTSSPTTIPSSGSIKTTTSNPDILSSGSSSPKTPKENDSSTLSPTTSSPNGIDRSSDRPSFEGYLFVCEKSKKSGSSSSTHSSSSNSNGSTSASSSSSSWKRKYFRLENGQLYHLTETKNSEVLSQGDSVIDMAVATVKTKGLSKTNTANRDFCFEVLSPYHTFLLQAENQSIMDKWVNVVREAIEYELSADSAPELKISPNTNEQNNTPTPVNTLATSLKSKGQRSNRALSIDLGNINKNVNTGSSKKKNETVSPARRSSFTTPLKNLTSPKSKSSTPSSSSKKKIDDDKEPLSPPTSAPGSTESLPSNKHQTRKRPDKKEVLDLLYGFDPDNKRCVDCQKSDPTWASINLGALVCIDCSGIHRSLGVHITQVRSLTLDSLDPEIIKMFELMGNKNVNKIFHPSVVGSTLASPMNNNSLSSSPIHSIPPTISSPTISSKYSTSPLPSVSEKYSSLNSQKDSQYEYITNKYVKKLYVQRFQPNNIQELLIKSVKQGRVMNVLKLIAQNANPNQLSTVNLPSVLQSNSTTSNNGPVQMTSLHVATLIPKNGVTMVALILNNANVDAKDTNGQTPLHYAAIHSLTPSIAILLKYGASYNVTDNFGKTPLDYALKSELADNITLLRLATIARQEKLETNKSTLEEAINDLNIDYGPPPRFKASTTSSPFTTPSSSTQASPNPTSTNNTGTIQTTTTNVGSPRIVSPRQKNQENKSKRRGLQQTVLTKYTTYIQQVTTEKDEKKLKELDKVYEQLTNNPETSSSEDASVPVSPKQVDDDIPVIITTPPNTPPATPTSTTPNTTPTGVSEPQKTTSPRDVTSDSED
eukprot:TRINITY_DN8118_c0_g1_i1.p1 TRINITY_DN8118_c0_g1~~TRINITY_DN8118_c0_g1_i1.p1  ORF type:complete len:1058 (+),score=273.96 TRINITY_DN8118_c0_g1_i1:183-3176(+)